MKQMLAATLALLLLPSLAWSAGWNSRNHRPPRDQITWEIIDVEGAEYVCFTTRLGAIDCQRLFRRGILGGEAPLPVPPSADFQWQRPPRSEITWEIIDVEAAQYVCFTTRLGAIDCQPLFRLVGGLGGNPPPVPPGTE